MRIFYDLKKNCTSFNTHFVPYKGTYAGDAPILEVFEETIKKENGDYKRNSLFGREIFGVNIDLKGNGFILEKEDDITFKIKERIENITIWKHDEKPDKNEKIHEILTYCEAMDSLNKEII